MSNLTLSLRRHIATIVTLVFALSPAFAPAQEGRVLEEVVVTAQKREESLQDVPISITTISGDAIRAGGIQRMDALAPTVPNFHYSEAVTGSDQIFIRGIGAGVNSGFEMAVGQVIDGFFYGRSRFGRAAFLDIERIEVLKGPQGALIGKNTSAGAINITTRKPTDEFEGYISPMYEFEADDGFTVEGAVSGPLTDTLKARLAVRYDDRDGWVENIVTGEETQSVDDIAARGTVVWEPSDTFDATLQYMYADYNRDGRTRQASICDPGFLGFLAATGSPIDCKANLINTLVAPRLGMGNFQTFKTDFDVVGLTLNWRIGNHTLTSLTGYAGTDWHDTVDVDESPAEQLGADFKVQESQWTQELRLIDEAGGQFDYIAGFFFQHAEVDTGFDLHLCLPFFPVCNPSAPPSGTRVIRTDQEGDAVAFFGQLTWYINDYFSATFSGRFTHEEKDGVSEQFPAFLYTHTQRFPGGAAGLGNVHFVEDDIVENNFSPGGNVRWRLNDDIMFYFSGRRGFKGGGFDHQLNAGQAAAVNKFSFNKESVTAYEVGSKLTLLDGAAQLNIALFREEFDDLQISALQPDVSFAVGNAASAISQGVEADGRWRVTEDLTLTAAMSYLDGEYDEFQDAPCNAEQVRTADPACTFLTPTTGVQDLSDQALQFAPEWSFVFDAEYVWRLPHSLELASFLRAYYRDDVFLATDLDPNVVQEGYWKFDGRLTLTDADNRWELSLIGRNLGNNITSNFGNDGNGSAANIYFKFMESPRAIALQGMYRF